MERLIYFVDSPGAVAFHYDHDCASLLRAENPIVEERVDALTRTVTTETYGDLHLCHFCEVVVADEAAAAGGFRETAHSHRTTPPPAPPAADPDVVLHEWKQDYSKLRLYADRVEIEVRPPLATDVFVRIPLETITKVVVVDWIPLVRRPRVEITHGSGEEEAVDEFVPDVREHWEVGQIVREAAHAARTAAQAPPPVMAAGAGLEADDEPHREIPGRRTKVRIDPKRKNVLPGLGWAFTFEVNGKPAEANWTIDNPDIGTIDSDGTFHAAKGYRVSRAKITATTLDGKLKSTADVRVQVHQRAGRDIGLADSSPVPGLEGLPWNDEQGRRAALLIFDVLEQLPKAFLQAVGPCAVVRARHLKPFDNADGIHLPLPAAVVFLSDSNLISTLTLKAEITDEDRWLQRVFIHELAHVVLANKALPDIERWTILATAALALATAGHTRGLSLVTSPLSVFYQYYWGRDDYLTEWARVTGWVINNPNPLGLFSGATTVHPNAVTGLILFGRFVGLRNPTTKGFVTPYARTDAHEDFADSIAAMALGEPAAADADFAPRRDFILTTGAWPRNAKVVEHGKTYNQWADANLRPRPDMRGWAVDFGLRVTGGQPRPGVRPSTLEAESLADGADEDDWDAGEGGGVPLDEDVLPQIARLTGAIESLTPVIAAFDEHAAPVMGELDAIVAQLSDAPADPADTLGWLRSAERHGEGLRAVGTVTLDDDGLAIGAGPLARGDVLVDRDGVLLAVATVARGGRATRLIAPTLETGDAEYGLPELAADRFRLAWRPSAAERSWGSGVLDAMLRTVIGLWGSETGTKGRDLTVPGDFLAEVLAAAGHSTRGLAGTDDEAARAWCKKHGALTAADATPPAPGDVVRLRAQSRWGVCVRGPGGDGAVDVLAMGGEEPGPLGEEDDAARMLHGVAAAELAHVWRPAPLG